MMGLKLQLASILLPLAALAAAPREKIGFDPAVEPGKASSIYFAPENDILFRMRYPDGSYREFERDFAHPDRIKGSNGWRGSIGRAGRVTLVSGPKIEGGSARFVFERGRLVAFEQGNFATNFPYATVRSPAGAVPPYYFGDETLPPASGKADKSRPSRRLLTKEVAREISKKWKGSGRLAWPFDNPNANGCLYAMLALVSTLLFHFKRKEIKILGGVLFLAGSACLVLTASRGSILAFAAGLAPAALLNAKTLAKNKAVWIVAAAVGIMAAVYCAVNPKLFTRGFRGKSSWSNEIRLQMWKSAPQMIAEAPGGWHYHVGRANLDWYQPLDELSMPGSLINDHLTRTVSYGTCGRFLYLFAWIAGLSLLALFAWWTRNGVALGIWILFGVAAWFNPVFVFQGLWVVAVAGTAAAVAVARPWQRVKDSRRLVAAPVAAVCVSAVLSAAILGAIVWTGSGTGERGYPVLARNGSVLVKGRNPVVWLVDDSKALGGVLACKEVRSYYAANPDAQPLGYTRDVANLPENIHRLVLAGDAGVDWLDKITSSEEARANLPKEVLFVSPPFPASAIPPGLLSSCRVRVVLGEFAAIYEEEYSDPPPWVEIVPGMELYLNRWVDFVFEDWSGDSSRPDAKLD